MPTFEDAIRHDDVAQVRALLATGANLHAGRHLSPLSLAAITGSMAVMRLLVELGAAVDSRGDDGRTALSHAAEFPRLGPVRFLLDAGAEVDALDADGLTPLLRGVFSADTSAAVIAALVDAAADVTIRDPTYGRTPHEWAEQRPWRHLLLPPRP